MSSNCPPQLHLELPPNTTSFKRSFDQFGFDLDSPQGASDAAGASASDGNDRNKRARSASSFSDDEGSIASSSSSTLASGSSPISGDSSTPGDSMSSHLAVPPRLAAVPHLSLNLARSSFEPPRLPTPEIQDIDMNDYPLREPGEAEEASPASQANTLNLISVASTPSQAEENYRLSLERFNAFDTQIAALRRSHSPSLPRSPTPPPVLPPLELLGEEAPMNTNSISFLHPPAQPSPPLPHSLYSHGPSRNQQPGSRSTSRNEPLLDDPRRLPHETHTQSSSLGESSAASRDLTEGGSRTDEEWNRITQNVRSARGDGVYRRGTPWSFWPAPGEGADDNDNGIESDEEEEEEVQEVLEQPNSWSSPAPPTLGELRSPSPLFNHLDDLDQQPPPVLALPPRRADEDAAPPTLPPIEDQVLSHPWDVPMEEMLESVWSRYPGDRMPQTTQQSQPHPRSIHPPPPPRIFIPSGFREREREQTPAEDNVSISATTGSASDVASPVPGYAHVHPVPAPSYDVAWLDREEPWYFRGPEQEPGPSSGRASRGPSGTHAHPTATMSANSHSASNSNSGSSSHNTGEPSSSASVAPPPTVSPSILDTYAASRLQALQGIGSALEGIGQVLRESEMTLAPYLREGSHSSGGSANTNIGGGSMSTSTSTSTANVTVGESSRSSRSPVRSGAEGRTSAWRSISSSASASGEETRQRAGEEPVRGAGMMRMNVPVPLDYIELDWPLPSASSESLLLPDSIFENDTEDFRNAVERMNRRFPSTAATESFETLLPDSTSESETESFSDATERMASHASSAPPTGSLERLRQRAVALQAAVRDMDERWPDRSGGISGNGHIDEEMSGSPHPSMRLLEPVELFLSPWDSAPGISSGRDRALPTNTSMLFNDGPSPSPLSNDNQQSTSTTDRTSVSGWRSVEPVIPRVREPPSRSPEREREIERERLRLNERPWLRAPPRTSSNSSPLLSGTLLSNLRARPYVSQSSTHAHGHSYSQNHSSASSHLPLSSAGHTENAADAQRRIARLGLIQMQRQRTNSGRMRSVESPFASSASSTSSTFVRPLPPRPRGFDSFPPRSSSPDRNSYRLRLAEHRARLDGIREPDTTSSLYNAAMNTLDLSSSRSSGESSPERPHPPSGLRFLRRSFDRSVDSTSSSDSSSFSTASGGINSRRLRFPTLHNLDRTVRELQPEFLPVPSLPSPGLEFEFAPVASASNGPGVSEAHNDHRTSARSSRFEVSHAAPARRSPSPVHRRIERSPPRRSSPPGHPRYIDPDVFAPGPFRNTIQSFRSAMTNNRSGSRPLVSPSRESAGQPQSHVTPPSLPPLAFEEEHRSTAQRPGRSHGDLTSSHRNEIDETATAHLRAFLSRHPLPPPDRPPTPQRFSEVLHQLDSPLDVLDRILIPQNSTTQPTPTAVDSPSDDRNMFDSTPGWLDGDNASPRRLSTSSYRPPWRALHLPRAPTNPPSDIHSLLNRLPRTEAIRRETSRRPLPMRGSEDGFNHAIEALRNDRFNVARSQEVLNRTQFDTSREPRTRPSASPWGILEQSQGNAASRRTSNDQLNGEVPVNQRRRRHVLPIRPDPLPSFPMMDMDDEVFDTMTFLHDRARFLSRRVRGPGGEAPVFPRRIPTLMRSSNGIRRGRPLGDYIPDEDWNSDYESLLSLAAQLGDVKPRSTPAEVISSLETGLYKDWKTPDSDHRCPICLDDYQPDDPLLKLSDCSHWLHSECLQQWLKGATTCPVCRETVVGPSHGVSSDEAGPSQRRNSRDGHEASGRSESEGEGAPGSSNGISPIRRHRRFL